MKESDELFSKNYDLLDERKKTFNNLTKDNVELLKTFFSNQITSKQNDYEHFKKIKQQFVQDKSNSIINEMS